MNAQDRSEFLRTRVSAAEKKNFEEVCAAVGSNPAEQLRKYVTEFVNAHAEHLSEQFTVHVFKPEDSNPPYDPGAWKVIVRLKYLVVNHPILFRIPKLENRIIHSDPGYFAAWPSELGHHEICGLLNNGIWTGHIYSNGISESDNPTSIEIVREKLVKEIKNSLFYLPKK